MSGVDGVVGTDLAAIKELATNAHQRFENHRGRPQPEGFAEAVTAANKALQIVNTMIELDRARWAAANAEGEAKRHRAQEAVMTELLAEQQLDCLKGATT